MSLLLTGVTGCGKSACIEALVHEMRSHMPHGKHLPFLYADFALRPSIERTETNVRDMFSHLKYEQAGVLFFDFIDGFLGHALIQDTLKDELATLKEASGMYYVFGATDRPQYVPRAIFGPGGIFDAKSEVFWLIFVFPIGGNEAATEIVKCRFRFYKQSKIGWPIHGERVELSSLALAHRILPVHGSKL